MNIKGSLSYQLHFVDEQSTDGKPTDQNEMHFVLILTLLLGKLLYLLFVFLTCRDFVYVTTTMKHNGSVIAINKIRRSFGKLFFND